MDKLLIIVAVVASFNQISCQFLDYDSAEDVGLAEGFQPSVKVSCVGGTMKIRVDTKKPFQGIIHGPNRTEPGCSKAGNSGLKTYLNIDLTRPEGSVGSCGVKYTQRTEERRLALAVRAHPTIELLEDRLYVVTCGRAGFQNSRNEVSVVELKVTLPSDPTRKINTVLEGRRYKLRAEVLEHDPEFDIQMKKCFAFDETDTSLTLVDDRGCSKDRLISEFTYDRSAGTAEATLYSMFRLPHSNKTYFQCDVAICLGTCPKPKCDDTDESLTLESEGQLTTIQQEGDPFDKPEDDTVTTSTSVYVAQPGSAASANAVYCSGVGFGPGDSHWLKWLCIAFGILFGVMLLINIFLCSAMTCSCTRSEIIEKEPSVYDDYSIYDSQYGYTNKYSESDYGSEYGMVDNNGQAEVDGGRGQMSTPGVPAPSGNRVPSEYSHHGSTLNRSRH